MRKTFITGLMAAALMGVGLGFASPAQAGSLTDNGNGTFTVALAAGEQVVICASSTTENQCLNSDFPTNPPTLYATTANGTYGAGSTVTVQGVPTSLPAGTYTIVLRTFPPPINLVASLLNFTVTSGGGGSSSSTTTSQPQPVALSINTVDGSACSQSSESGFAGSWMTLPGADDCTAPATKPEATLLGWATDANFPVEIAQRQIDNGWGAYEMFNDEGRLTAVFIPAGGATFLSGDGNLFAIWSE